jgi:hypothetical protein
MGRESFLNGYELALDITNVGEEHQSFIIEAAEL